MELEEPRGTGAVDDLELCPGNAGGHPRAAVESRNGSGVNPETLSWLSLPVISGTFTAALDCAATGPGLEILEVRRHATSGSSTVGGEGLVSGELVFRTVRPHSGGTSVLTWAIPHDLALAGTSVYVQALCRAASSHTADRSSEPERSRWGARLRRRRSPSPRARPTAREGPIAASAVPPVGSHPSAVR